MAGVLGHIRRSRRKLVKDYVSSAGIDLKVLELRAAAEILAEVFGTDISEIDEMLRLRFQEDAKRQAPFLRKKQGWPLLKHRYGEAEAEEWPMEFCLAE